MSAPRRVLFVDGSSGASGDMILGALVDLGVPLARLRKAIERVPIDGWRMRSRRIRSCGLAGRKVDVRVAEDAPGRGWKELQRLLRRSTLTPEVRDRCLRVFRRLIEAEARVHGSDPDRVHLHEAGAIDAIVDVVGACEGLAALEIDQVVVSTLTTGSGRIRCAHGDYPVPGPATLELLRGVPAQAGPVAVERLTPTGAAILTTVADAYGPMPLMRPLAVGYGAGSRDLGDTPNLLRVVLGEQESGLEAPATDEPVVAVVECDVDDSTPQNLAYATRLLLDRGALDVVVHATTMKKGRSGHRVTVITRPDELHDLARILLTETTTLGLRYRFDRRIELDREIVKIDAGHGAIDVKVAYLDGRLAHAWPEFEQCAKQARQRDVSLAQVQREVLRRFETKQKTSRRKKP